METSELIQAAATIAAGMMPAGSGNTFTPISEAQIKLIAETAVAVARKIEQAARASAA